MTDERDREAHRAKPAQVGLDLLLLLVEQDVFREFQLDVVRAQSGAIDHRAKPVDEIGGTDLRLGDVDRRPADIEAEILETPDGVQRPGDDPFAERDREPAFLR